jgi:hypothetical protein
VGRNEIDIGIISAAALGSAFVWNAQRNIRRNLMKTILVILLSLVAAISLAAAYTPEQQATIDGLRLSYQIGQAYEKYLQSGDASGFNVLVDQWNAWVQTNFGQDANLLMQKLAGPMNLQAPYILANNTTTPKGIVHQIDGANKVGGASYTTNDVNLLPDNAIAQYNAQDQAVGGANLGTGYLGGV